MKGFSRCEMDNYPTDWRPSFLGERSLLQPPQLGLFQIFALWFLVESKGNKVRSYKEVFQAKF